MAAPSTCLGRAAIAIVGLDHLTREKCAAVTNTPFATCRPSPLIARLDGSDFFGGVGSAYALKVDSASGKQIFDATSKVAGGDVGVQVCARACRLG